MHRDYTRFTYFGRSVASALVPRAFPQSHPFFDSCSSVFFLASFCVSIFVSWSPSVLQNIIPHKERWVSVVPSPSLWPGVHPRSLQGHSLHFHLDFHFSSSSLSSFLVKSLPYPFDLFFSSVVVVEMAVLVEVEVMVGRPEAREGTTNQ